MVGRTRRFPCGCCHDNTKRGERRAAKRRERQNWKKEIRNGNA